MEDPRIISALFIFLKMAYYNVLINRLGLKLDIASTEKEYTRLTITFPKGTVHNFSE